MGSVSSAKTVFEAGLAEGDSRLAPFEYARLQLTYGAFLRRQGRRRAAKAHLESARDQLHLLGAAPVLERCEQELTGTGLRPNRRTVDQRNVLTSRELTVARLVAEGMSNREVAERLVVSTKTIEYHLNNVFAKLGLRSRGQLVRHVLEQQSPAPGRNPGGYPGAKRDIERGG
jgi:DNA-binding CsgD family transcriptional regulator